MRTQQEWEEIATFVESTASERRGIVPEMQYSEATFRAYAERQILGAMKDGEHSICSRMTEAVRGMTRSPGLSPG